MYVGPTLASHCLELFRGIIMNIQRFLSADLEDLILVERQLCAESKKVLKELSRIASKDTAAKEKMQNVNIQLNQEIKIVRKIIEVKQKQQEAELTLAKFMKESESLMTALKEQNQDIDYMQYVVNEMTKVITEQQELIESLSKDHPDDTDKVSLLISSGKKVRKPAPEEASYISKAIASILGTFMPFEIPDDHSCTNIDERKLHKLCSTLTHRKFPCFGSEYFDAFMLSICFRLDIGIADDKHEILMPEDLSPREISHLSRLAQLMILYGSLTVLPTISSCEGHNELLRSVELEIYSMSDGTIFGDILKEKATSSYSLYERILRGDKLNVVIHEEHESKPKLRATRKAQARP